MLYELCELNLSLKIGQVNIPVVGVDDAHARGQQHSTIGLSPSRNSQGPWHDARLCQGWDRSWLFQTASPLANQRNSANKHRFDRGMPLVHGRILYMALDPTLPAQGPWHVGYQSLGRYLRHPYRGLSSSSALVQRHAETQATTPLCSCY